MIERLMLRKKNWDYGIMRRHLSYHYNWYVLPDKSFIICKVCDVFWATTSINFLVILSFYYTTHLFFQTQNTLVQMNFLVLFSFPKNCLKSLPCIKKNSSPPSSYFQLLLKNQWKNFNDLCTTTIITTSRCINCW